MLYNKKILVVDADPNLEDKLRPILAAQHYQSLFVTNASDGLKIAADWQPHLILLDLVLPNMSGLGFLREAKYNSKIKNIPVLVFSDLNDGEVIFEALELGAVGYVTKEDCEDELLATVKECLPWLKSNARQTKILEA